MYMDYSSDKFNNECKVFFFYVYDIIIMNSKASDTFVTHSRANFYFLLTSETQDMNEFATKRKPSKRTNTRTTTPTHRPSTSSNSNEEVDSSRNNKDSPKTLDSDKIDSSIESIKQMKGIINMQIRDGR